MDQRVGGGILTQKCCTATTCSRSVVLMNVVCDDPAVLARSYSILTED